MLLFLLIVGWLPACVFQAAPTLSAVAHPRLLLQGERARLHDVSSSRLVAWRNVMPQGSTTRAVALRSGRQGRQERNPSENFQLEVLKQSKWWTKAKELPSAGRFVSIYFYLPFAIPTQAVPQDGGPSKWQQRKEAKRQMYLQSTEKQVTIRRSEREYALFYRVKVVTWTKFNWQCSNMDSVQCQNCLLFGHWTYMCKNSRYIIRSHVTDHAYTLQRVQTTAFPIGGRTKSVARRFSFQARCAAPGTAQYHQENKGGTGQVAQREKEGQETQEEIQF